MTTLSIPAVKVEQDFESICDSIHADPYGVFACALGSSSRHPLEATVDLTRWGRRKTVSLEVDVGSLRLDRDGYAEWPFRWTPVHERSVMAGAGRLQFTALRSLQTAPVDLALLLDVDAKVPHRRSERISRHARGFIDELAGCLESPPE